jgi:Major intrinsic protein
VEFVLTFLLMLSILNVSTGPKEKAITAGVAVGAVTGLEAMFAGPICGASINPARSFAPALVSMHFEHLWFYIGGPPLGAWLPTFACRWTHDPRLNCGLDLDQFISAALGRAARVHSKLLRKYSSKSPKASLKATAPPRNTKDGR